MQQHIPADNAPGPPDLEVERVVETHPHDLFQTHKTHAAKATASQVVAEVNGILAYGFLRLKCQGCTEERIVAFSCKKRGFCPSCCAKRKAESAAHLVDGVLPLAPYRQMVLSFPIPLRYWLHTNKKLFAKVHAIIIKQMHRYYNTQS